MEEPGRNFINIVELNIEFNMPLTNHNNNNNNNNNNNTNINTLITGGDQAAMHVSEGIEALSVNDYEALGSRESICKEILDVLASVDGVRMIGVHGMGGIGKSTLVKRVATEARRKRLFYKVIMVTVTQNPMLKNIQREIAEHLGMELKEESERMRAARICIKLKQEKKILVIFDDLWKKLNLSEVGFPDEDELGGCKILLTSRKGEVLSSGMGCQKTFPVGDLPREEAWDLFQKMASGDKFGTQDIRSVATEVARECEGLPVAIGTVASALKNESLPAWRDALRELQRPSPMHDVVLGDVARVIASRDHPAFVKRIDDVELKCPPDKDTTKKCQQISLNGKVVELPENTPQQVWKTQVLQDYLLLEVAWTETQERQTIAMDSRAINAKHNGKLDKNQCLPFLKKSPVWNDIESMEIFKIVPQKPHFRPLIECKEDYREGSAIGLMVTFDNLCRKISSLQFDDPRSAFERTLESLQDLEKHGFYVTVPRDRVNKLLLIKDGEDELLNESKDVERQVRKHNYEKRKLDEKITELQEELAFCKSKLESKDLEIAKLHSHFDAVDGRFVNARHDFERIATASWKLP